mmetsp:Transcript_29637/g.80109  ORF Transcript_29637/g.80109 Transcript_29637/m.80109 type:complete len:135 (-) Transcript_29637:186-590(-)
MPVAGAAGAAALALEPVTVAPRGLVGQGFHPPDFDLRHLQETLQQMIEKAGVIGEAAGKAEESLTHAAAAAEQVARHADMVSRMPSSELPDEAFGSVEGLFPPRHRWGRSLVKDPIDMAGGLLNLGKRAAARFL